MQHFTEEGYYYSSIKKNNRTMHEGERWVYLPVPLSFSPRAVIHLAVEKAPGIGRVSWKVT